MSSARPRILGQERLVEIGCALAATCLGIAYLMAAGAPATRSIVNGVAFLLGVVALVGIGRALPKVSRYAGALILVMGLSLLVTAVLGADAEGASRWVMVGPLSVQPSLVLLPFMAVTFARYPTPAGCIGIAVAAAALALQPDRAMAGVLASSMAVLAITKRSRLPVGASIVSFAGFLLSLGRADTLPAVAYVDQILFTAFAVHLLADAAVWLGSLLLLVPPILGWRSSADLRPAYFVSGAVWFGCIAAAALGNYPTPVVGYGGSAILGYLLTFAFLPARSRSASRHAAAADEDDVATRSDLESSASLA